MLNKASLKIHTWWILHLCNNPLPVRNEQWPGKERQNVHKLRKRHIGKINGPFTWDFYRELVPSKLFCTIKQQKII